MKILAIEKNIPGVEEDQFTSERLKSEAVRALELYQAGVIRELYFRRDKSTAVLVLEADSLEKARTALQTLPLVRQKLIDFDVIPLRPYPGFARLVAED
jgi:muconolactone delta-isomerase